jgi:hypothetical protein
MKTIRWVVYLALAFVASVATYVVYVKYTT